MRRSIACLVLMLLPQIVWAQRVPMIVLVLAAVPVVNILLAIVYAFVSASARNLMAHIGLALLWLVLFWIFASYTGSDFLAWLPVGLSVVHSLWLIVFGVRTLVQKRRQA